MASEHSLPSVSTGAGDTGTSTLCSDERIRKNAPVFNFMGRIDELSCYLGVCCLYVPDDAIKKLRRAQNHLSEILGCVACDLPPSRALAQFAVDVKGWRFNLEMKKKTDQSDRFSLPREETGASYLRIAKGICCRAERVSETVKCDDAMRRIIGPVLKRLGEYLGHLAPQQEQSRGKLRGGNEAANR
jgi:cob(I)alamin adenosyltransferase